MRVQYLSVLLDRISLAGICQGKLWNSQTRAKPAPEESGSEQFELSEKIYPGIIWTPTEEVYRLLNFLNFLNVFNLVIFSTFLTSRACFVGFQGSPAAVPTGPPGVRLSRELVVDINTEHRRVAARDFGTPAWCCAYCNCPKSADPHFRTC